jgi:putative AbiEi antitoxin of type IV toxin-antitoxin system
MRDAQVAELAGRQFNRVSRAQLAELGLSEKAIVHRLDAGRLVRVEEGVFTVAPVREDDDWGKWMGATLTAPGSVLSQVSAAAAWGTWSLPRQLETVTRPGRGGPRRHGDVLVFRSLTLDGDCTQLRGIPITRIERTLLDVARVVSERALARAMREALRLRVTTVAALGDSLGRYQGRRGSARLARAVARFTGLPAHRARSGAEIRAMGILRDAGRPLPNLNVRIAGEEADLSWPRRRLIVEIDGAPFHLDRGEDARKAAAWAAAGWKVRRLPADDVYERPLRLLDLAA